MDKITIRVSRKDIENTNTFQKFDKIVKSILLKRQNVLAIENAINICKNRGLDYWERQTQSSNRNIEIVKELYNEK